MWNILLCMCNYEICHCYSVVTETGVNAAVCVCAIRLLHQQKLELLQLSMSQCLHSVLLSVQRRHPSSRLLPFRQRLRKGQLKFWQVFH